MTYSSSHRVLPTHPNPQPDGHEAPWLADQPHAGMPLDRRLYHFWLAFSGLEHAEFIVGGPTLAKIVS
jgi:hypothetical protein